MERPRGIDLAPNKDIIVVDRSLGVFAFWEDDDNKVKSAQLLDNSLGLNHGIRFHGGYIYMSSSSTVYRWPYSKDEHFRKPLTSETVVIRNIPTGGHVTRTIEFDDKGRLYLSIGSRTNIDEDSSRSRVVRFDLSKSDLPIDFEDGEVFADGTRNSVAIRFDNKGRLWGVENGIDNIGVSDETRKDLGDVHVYNPAEEVNIFLEENKDKFYGYPYCWSEGIGPDPDRPSFPKGKGPLTQWATKLDNPPYDDEWCRDESNVIKPVYAFPAHVAPLDIIFYTSDKFPGYKNNVAFVSFHGSWNTPDGKEVGRKVEKLKLDKKGNPVSSEPFFWGPNSTWKYRPVGLVVAPCKAYKECLYITDDNDGNIISIGYSSGYSIKIASSILISFLLITFIMMMSS